jgi:hypothetical protein
MAKNYEVALKESFLKMDDLLVTPNGRKQIEEITSANPPKISPLEKAL